MDAWHAAVHLGGTGLGHGIAKNQFGAQRAEQRGHGPADAAGGAGHENGLPGKRVRSERG
ncbi:hypothetical protein D3C86_2240860 [compost metagenome]